MLGPVNRRNLLQTRGPRDAESLGRSCVQEIRLAVVFPLSFATANNAFVFFSAFPLYWSNRSEHFGAYIFTSGPITAANVCASSVLPHPQSPLSRFHPLIQCRGTQIGRCCDQFDLWTFSLLCQHLEGVHVDDLTAFALEICDFFEIESGDVEIVISPLFSTATDRRFVFLEEISLCEPHISALATHWVERDWNQSRLRPPSSESLA